MIFKSKHLRGGSGLACPSVRDHFSTKGGQPYSGWRPPILFWLLRALGKMLSKAADFLVYRIYGSQALLYLLGWQKMTFTHPRDEGALRHVVSLSSFTNESASFSINQHESASFSINQHQSASIRINQHSILSRLSKNLKKWMCRAHRHYKSSCWS